MNRIYYGDYIKQARDIFNTSLIEIRNFEKLYDLQTDRSNNQVKQQEWNNKLKKMLPN